MKIKKLKLAGLFVIEPNIFYDKRGFLYETYNENLYFHAIYFNILPYKEYPRSKIKGYTFTILRITDYYQDISYRVVAYSSLIILCP